MKDVQQKKELEEKSKNEMWERTREVLDKYMQENGIKPDEMADLLDMIPITFKSGVWSKANRRLPKAPLLRKMESLGMDAFYIITGRPLKPISEKKLEEGKRIAQAVDEAKAILSPYGLR